MDPYYRVPSSGPVKLLALVLGLLLGGDLLRVVLLRSPQGVSQGLWEQFAWGLVECPASLTVLTQLLSR